MLMRAWGTAGQGRRLRQTTQADALAQAFGAGAPGIAKAIGQVTTPQSGNAFARAAAQAYTAGALKRRLLVSRIVLYGP